MATGPVVSILVPAYRASAYLPRCIESVMAQTFTDWELIIVEQSGSGTQERQRCAAVVREYQERDPGRARIRLVAQENAGASGGRNRGIEEAQGRYIAFLDADDEFLPRKLERQLELLTLRPDLGLVYSDYAFIDLQGLRHESVFDELAPVARQVPAQAVAPGLYVCPDNLFEHLARQYFIATIVGLVRRDVLGSEVRFSTRHRYAEEWLFYLEVVRRARAGFVDEPLCLHHHVAGSVSRTSSADNLEQLAGLLEHMLSHFRDASRQARACWRRQLARVRLDLGMQAHRAHDYRRAAWQWGRSFAAAPGWRALARWMDAKALLWRSALRPVRDRAH